MDFPENLKHLRESRNISQKYLADKIGVSQASIGYWEKGQRIPSMDACVKLADYFEVSILELLGIENDAIPGKIRMHQQAYTLEDDEFHLLTLYNRLNKRGKSKVISYASDLTKISKYRKDTE